MTSWHVLSLYDFKRQVQRNKWCHAYNWEPFERYVVKSCRSAQLKLFYRWQQGEVATILVIPRCTVILQQLFKIFDYPQRGDAIMAENQFQGHQEKSKSLQSANRAKGLCERREGIFFLIIVSVFPLLRVISQQHQRALLLVRARARSWSCSELLVM